MPITLTGYESHDGMSEMVAVEVSDFADGSQVALVIEESDAVLRKINRFSALEARGRSLLPSNRRHAAQGRRT